MSKNKSNERRVRVRAVRRSSVDVKKLGRALIALAMAQAEAEAQEAHSAKKKDEDGRRRVA